MNARVRSGLDVLVAEKFRRLRGKRVGLVTHPAAADVQLRHAADLLTAAPDVQLVALFGPEHGLLGHAQDLIGVREPRAKAGPRVVSLYGDSVESLQPTREQFDGIDVLVIDLQDVGTRYYTFQATMLYCLESAAGIGLPVVVLDRPNPIGGTAVEGPILTPGFESFVGAHPIPTRHGLTIGELAALYRSERRLEVDLDVVPCAGWRREMYFQDTGLPWVMPSPNMPTPDTALVYPGQCLLEGTNLSEGRGTTRPFELCGAPDVDARQLAARLTDEGWPGVTFRSVCYQPIFHKFAGQLCGGVQLHVRDRGAYQAVRTGVAVLAAFRNLLGDRFDWRRAPYEFVADRLAIDLLFGGDRERRALESGADPRDIAEAWVPEEAAFRLRREPFLLYGN